MSKKISNIIEQSTFLGIYGKIRIEFEENGVRIYDSYRESECKENFFAYKDIDLHNPTKIKIHELYYLLVWSAFFVFWLLARDIFFLVMWSIFFFLYFRSCQKHIILNYWLILLDDKKYPQIIERIREVQIPIRKEEEYKIFSYSSKESEIERMKKLRADGVISEDELQDMISQIELFQFGWSTEVAEAYIPYENEKMIISDLLENKWITGDFTLENIRYESESLPRIQSLSWEIHLTNGDIYEFWLRWDKNSIDPKTGKNGIYSLGDDAWTIEQYGRSFFEIVHK